MLNNRMPNCGIGDKLYCIVKRQILGIDYGNRYTIKGFKRVWVETYTGDYEIMGVQFEETRDRVFTLEYFAKRMPMKADPVRLDEELFKV